MVFLYNSLECPCKETFNATRFQFNIKYEIVSIINIHQLYKNPPPSLKQLETNRIHKQFSSLRIEYFHTFTTIVLLIFVRGIKH